MNVSVLSLLLAIALVVPAAAQTDAAAQPPEAAAAQVGTQADTEQPAAAETAPAAEAESAPAAEAEAAPAAEAEAAPATQPVVTPEMIQEFEKLHREIVRARTAIRKSEELEELYALRETAIQEKDVAAIHQLSTDIYTKTEALLTAQPGMVEKLARFKELGEIMSRDLPATKRRKGKRLPKRADEPRPAGGTSDANR